VIEMIFVNKFGILKIEDYDEELTETTIQPNFSETIEVYPENNKEQI
jgi:hypothetical protein